MAQGWDLGLVRPQACDGRRRPDGLALISNLKPGAKLLHRQAESIPEYVRMYNVVCSLQSASLPAPQVPLICRMRDPRARRLADHDSHITTLYVCTYISTYLVGY